MPQTSQAGNETMLLEAQPTWTRPRPSRARRTIPRKSTHHFVGQMTFGEDTGQGQCLQFESRLEYNTALLLIYRPGVVDVVEQVGPILLGPGEGRGLHFLDFVAVEARGRRTGVIVKPLQRAIAPMFRQLVARVAEAAIPHFVDRVVVVTERNIDPQRLKRAALFHHYRFPEPELDRLLSDQVDRLGGPDTIRQFCHSVGVGREGFSGAVRLIRRGRLETVVPWPITLDSVVRRAGAAA